jgi:arylsulfatase A-like enzyme
VIRDQLAECYGLITHLDQQVGRIMAALATSPQARNTVVVHAADHGLALGSHGLLGKQSLYERGMRCPLILAGPGIPKGRSIQGFTYLLDLFPTLCDLANLPAPAGLDGRSLRPLWSPDAATGPWRDSVFLAFTDTMRSFRDERWKLIVYRPQAGDNCLTCRRDPHERRNLAGSPGHRAREKALLSRLREAQERDGDLLPLSIEAPRPSSIDLSHGYRRNPDKEQPAWIVEEYFGR